MKIYNSLTRKKEEFVPIVPGKISMYVCGPTVYNYFHIGNGLSLIHILAFYQQEQGRQHKLWSVRMSY